MVSGLRVIALTSFTRRDRVILAASLSLGVGNLLVPDWSSYIFTYSGSNGALIGFYNSRKFYIIVRNHFFSRRLIFWPSFLSVIIILSTPFLIAGIVASLLNSTLPEDSDSIIEDVDVDELETGQSVEEDLKGN